MNQLLERLNGLTADEGKAEFLKCCGSNTWAEKMTAARPFGNAQALFEEAETLFTQLGESDWLQAFRAHPKIGGRKAETAQSEQAQKWSAQEQSGVTSATARTINELAAKNQQYEERFGFIFIVCATGKTPEEMLAILDGRIANDRSTELHTAAEEQRKITRLRLQKLLG